MTLAGQDSVLAVDFEALLEATSTPLEETVLRLLWSTGMRASAVAAFTPDRYDPNEGIIEVPPVKTEKPVTVEISDEDSGALQRCLNALGDEPFPIPPEEIQECLSRIADRTDQSEITSATFRRHFVLRQQLEFFGPRFRRWATLPTVPVTSVDELRGTIDEYLEARDPQLASSTRRQIRARLERFVEWIDETSSIPASFKLPIVAAVFISAHSDYRRTTRHQYLIQLRDFERWWTRHHNHNLHDMENS